MEKRNNRNLWGKAAIVIVLTAAVCWGALSHRAAGLLEDGLAAEQAGRNTEAVMMYERAALYFAPGNLYSAEAVEELERLAKAGDPASGQALTRIAGQLAPYRPWPLETRPAKTPVPAWQRAADLILFPLWTGGLLWLFFKGVTPAGAVVRREALKGTALFIGALAAWLTALSWGWW